MKNVLFALLFVVIFQPFALHGQGTTYNGGNLTISSDDDIPLNVATITTIDGNLILEGGLTFFPNFALLNEVQGNLVIQNLSHAPLTELNGLFSVLNTIDGDLTFINNAHLGVITGFHALDTLGGDFSIGGTGAGNLVLSSVLGFEALATIHGRFLVQQNVNITRLPAFVSLDSLGGDFHVEENTLLATIDGFRVLEVISGALNVLRNDALAALPSFLLLQSIGSNLMSSSPPISITNNVLLSDCCVLRPFLLASLPSSLSLGGDQTPVFADNVAGCNTSDFSACILSVNPAETDALPAAGGILLADIIFTPIAPNTEWTATANDAFITLGASMGATFSGTSHAVLSIHYAVNDENVRSGTITIATEGGTSVVLTLNQEATPLSVNPPVIDGLSHEEGGVSVFITLKAPATGWEAMSNDAFIFFETPGNASASGVASMLINLRYAENTGIARSSSVTITTTGISPPVSREISLSQAGGPPTIDITRANPTSSLPASGGTISTTITLGGGATGWLAEANINPGNFITLSHTSGTAVGGESLSITYTDNTTTGSRIGMVTVTSEGGSGDAVSASLTLMQEGGTHFILLSATPDVSVTPLSAASSGTIAVNIALSGGAIGWQATETDLANFITLTETNGVGSGILNIEYLANTGVLRTAEVSITTSGGSLAPRTALLSITQSGALPTLSVVTTPGSLSSLSAAGGEIQANITLGGGATGWEATSDDAFITLSASSGTIGEDLTITYEKNTDVARDGSVTIVTTGDSESPVESILSLMQVSASTLSVALTPTDISALSSAGGEIQASITLGGSATGWEATTSHDFITLSSPNGVHGEVLTITYDANAGISREGIVRLMTTGGTEEAGSESIIFTQEGAAPTLSVLTTPATLSALSSSGGEIQASITLGGGATAWEATTTSTFIALSSSNGVDGAVLTITYEENTGISRDGLVTIMTTGGSGSAVESAVAFTQEGAAPTLSVATTPLVLSGLSVDGGEIQTNITLGGGATAWEATSDDAFITLSSPNGVDGEVLTITYE